MADEIDIQQEAEERVSAIDVKEIEKVRQVKTRIEEIELDKIKVNEQPRKTFDDIEYLAKSIKRYGLINPIEVDEDYNLITGERRLRAFKFLRENRRRGVKGSPTFSKIPAKICSDVIGGVTIFKRQLAENIERENLRPLELARALQEFKEKFKFTNQEVAKQIFGSGRKEKKVRTLLALLNLPDEGKAALEEKKIPLSAAEEITRLKDHPEKQKKILKNAIEKKQSPLDVRQEVSRVLHPNSKSHIILVVTENGINWTPEQKIVLAPFKSAEKFVSEMDCVTGQVRSCKIVEDGK